MTHKNISKSNVVICTIFYQDLAGLKRLVNSVNDVEFIFVDGRFINWNGPILSEDGSREFLQSKGFTIIDAPDLIEYQKRNKYIETAQKLGYEYCIVIDSDEYVVKWDISDIQKDDCYKHEQLHDNSSHFPYYRIHKSTARHISKHQECFIGNKQIFNQDVKTIKLVTHHDKTLRSEQRQKYRLKYYNENPVR